MDGAINNLRQAIVDGNHKQAVANTNQLIADGTAPREILNDGLIAGMSKVGELFKQGEYFVPEMLIAARAMKSSLEVLRPKLVDSGIEPVGTIVLGTVRGDLHDIGKNLVKTILSNNGYTVHDLGKQVPANTIIEKAVEFNADAIGLSALLVSTSKQMPVVVNELARRGLKFPVLIGGAAINRSHHRRRTRTPPRAD
mgnify:CR=1 FL=1